MKKTKVRTSKILLWVVSAALVAILSVSLAFMGVALNRTKNLYKTDFSDLTGLASKTVLFIGDGMGENHIKTTETYYGGRVRNDVFKQRWDSHGQCGSRKRARNRTKIQ